MKGKVILLVTALVVIGLTIAIFNVAVDAWTTNLKLAAVVVCISEFAVICTMGLLPAMNYKNGSTGIMINVYAALVIIWTIIGVNIEGSAYPLGLLGISVVMAALIGMSVLGSHESDKLNDEVEREIDVKRAYTTGRPMSIAPKQPQIGSNLTSMWLSMQSTIDDPDVQKRVRVLVERIQAMPANRFPNQVIDEGMKQIAAMSRALEKTDDKQRVYNNMNVKIKELSNYIKTL